MLALDRRMCGIIGYIGAKDVVPVLVDGLRRLEYRGYDSAGIAVVRDHEIDVRRSAGKIVRLERAIRRRPIDGDYGVGHTRWATHGEPTSGNAHPHRDCHGRVVVVHNGIIDNYLDLRRQLASAGHRFTTETDSEVVAHLVEQEMLGDGLEHAVRRALPQLQGVFGLVIAAADGPDEMVAVRNGPPLVVGIGDAEFLVASDVFPIMPHTRNVVFLGDEEVAVISRTGVEFSDFAGRVVSKVAQRIPWDPIMAEKAGHKHFMLKEIFEQPVALQATMRGRISETGVVDLEKEGPTDLADIERVVILACGTSWHAGLVGKFLIEQLARVPVEVDYGSEYRYRRPIVTARTLAAAITQSGETADTLAALREARANDARSVAICNVVGSQVTRESEWTLYTYAGPEIGVASTKAFTSQLVAIHLLALTLAQARGTLSDREARCHIEALARLPALVQQTLQCEDLVRRISKRHYRSTNCLYLARGIHYPIALEGALKLKEISYIHAEGYPAGEMKHGPIALIEEGLPVVALLPDGAGFDKTAANVQEAKTRGACVIAVTDTEPGTLIGVLDPERDSVIAVPRAHPAITPLLMTIPLQLLAYHIAVLRGCDVDQPRNLAKSVTVE